MLLAMRKLRISLYCPRDLDAKTRESLEAQSDDPRIVSIVNNVVALGKTGSTTSRKCWNLPLKTPRLLIMLPIFPIDIASSGAAYSDTVAPGIGSRLEINGISVGAMSSIAALLLVLRDVAPRRFLWPIWRSRAKPTSRRRHGRPCDR